MPASSFSIGDASIAEGDSGTVMLTFTVTRTGDTSTTVVLSYATSNGTATAGEDYTAATGTVTIASGSTTGTISIEITGDVLVELDETFAVTLTGIVSTEGPPVSFTEQETFSVGSSAYSIVAGDLNGDGLRDLVVANCPPHGPPLCIRQRGTTCSRWWTGWPVTPSGTTSGWRINRQS